MADRHEAAAMTARSYENLVEREGLLDEICDAVDRSSHGAGSVLLLTGEAGIGKTSAVRAAVHRAGATTTVSWGRCAADRSAPPFWPWRDATGFAPATPHPAVHDGGDQAIGAERFDLLNRLRDQLVAQARHSPTLHVIEDLQWADVSSVLLLQHLATVVGNEPMVVVATLRTGEQLGSQLAGALDELGRLATVREVPPLSEAAVAKLVHGAGLSLDAETVADVCARTGGNPLFVTELLRTVRIGEDAERLHDVLAGSVPGRVSELISQRLAALPDPVAALVVTASVIGTEGDALLLAAVRDTGIDAVLDLLEQARAVHILDPAPSGRWRFRHDLVRDAVYASVPEPVRARQHAAALEALGAVGTTPAAILARHAVAALPLFDPERAVALAARAGESAFAGHAYEEAVDWFEVALATAPAQLETRWRAELLVLTGEAHRNLGAIERARQACVEAAELTDDPALLARAALGFADPGADLGIAYRTDDAVTTTLLERAIAANTATDSVTTVVLEARLAAELYFSDDPGRARSLATAAVDRAGRIGDAHALSAAHAVDHDAFVVGQAPLPDQLQGSERQLAWARESGSAAARLAAHRARVFDLLAAGDLIGVDAEVLAFRRIAEPLGVPGYLWWLGIWSAMRALLEGRHDDAEARALSAFELGARPFASLAAVNLSFLLFFLRREQGRLAELEQATRDHAASHADIPAIRVALALLLAETGGVDEASGLLTALVARGFDRLRDRNWPASWFQLARCAAL
ncbi:MAG: AAA family ATPase, partial [Acidimicrobiia bacterium]|nr:AAA family ATPase [Acidimicrobiia bacterium]